MAGAPALLLCCALVLRYAMLWHCSALLALLLCYAAMRCGTALRCYGCCAAAEGRCVTSSPLYLGMRLDNISDADLAIVSDVITTCLDVPRYGMYHTCTAVCVCGAAGIREALCSSALHYSDSPVQLHVCR